MEINFLSRPTSDNHNEMRNRNISTNRSISRHLLMSSTKSSVMYHKRMVNNGMDIDEELVKSTPALFYKIE